MPLQFTIFRWEHLLELSFSHHLLSANQLLPNIFLNKETFDPAKSHIPMPKP